MVTSDGTSTWEALRLYTRRHKFPSFYIDNLFFAVDALQYGQRSIGVTASQVSLAAKSPASGPVLD